MTPQYFSRQSHIKKKKKGKTRKRQLSLRDTVEVAVTDTIWQKVLKHDSSLRQRKDNKRVTSAFKCDRVEKAVCNLNLSPK